MPEPLIYTFTKELRPATVQDFFYQNNTPLYGCFYYVQSANTGKVEGPYCFSELTDRDNLREYFKAGMLFVEMPFK